MTANDNPTDLSGKVAVVTGAAAGLGRAEAIGLARSGATVVVNDIAPALGSSDVIDEIAAAGGKGIPVAGDISQRSTADELVTTADGLGGLNIVVNNAGITRDRMLFNMSDDDFDAVIAVHLRGHFLLTRNAAAYWRQKAKEAETGAVYGRIVNTSSEAGLMGPVGQANYGAAKAGITALTLSASRALSRYGVTANAICPRARTAMTAEVFGEAQVGEGEIDPLSPEHVVTLVRFLASPASAAVSGQVFVVYGPEVTLMAAPTVERTFSAEGQAWDPAGLSDTLANYFSGRDPRRTFSASELMDAD